MTAARAATLTVLLAVAGAASACGQQDPDTLADADLAALPTPLTSLAARTPSPSPTERPTVRPTPRATARPTPAATPVPIPTPVSTPTPAPAAPVWPTGAIDSYDAAGRIGQTATVCGTVVSPTYLSGGPTFLNLDAAYPNHHFTIVIWPEYRSLYTRPPEELFAGRTSCVAGYIGSYNGVAQIEARENMVWAP